MVLTVSQYTLESKQALVSARFGATISLDGALAPAPFDLRARDAWSGHTSAWCPEARPDLESRILRCCDAPTARSRPRMSKILLATPFDASSGRPGLQLATSSRKRRRSSIQSYVAPSRSMMSRLICLQLTYASDAPWLQLRSIAAATIVLNTATDSHDRSCIELLSPTQDCKYGIVSAEQTKRATTSRSLGVLSHQQHAPGFRLLSPAASFPPLSGAGRFSSRNITRRRACLDVAKHVLPPVNISFLFVQRFETIELRGVGLPLPAYGPMWSQLLKHAQNSFATWGL
jgi:hypothetical protein